MIGFLLHPVCPTDHRHLPATVLITPVQSECLLEYDEDMPPVETPTSRVPRVDPHLSGAGERVREAAAELERLGIANPDGSRIRKDLPKDMQSAADRDFGR